MIPCPSTPPPIRLHAAVDVTYRRSARWHRSHGIFNPLNLLHLFDLSFVGRRDEPALEFQGVSYTFGEIDARSNRMARLLTQRGLKGGDRLCIYLPNCVE